MTAIIPIPRIPIATRPAVTDDLPFIDGLQKLHTKQVGWMPTKQLEGKIAAGQVIIAEGESGRWGEGETGGTSSVRPSASPPLPLSPSPALAPVGYCIGQDQYFKRDDVGIIYQLNVAPGRQRSLIGATLLKATFDRAAYGCRLFCCWCAQDIAANHFWEACGFVPLAFRAGSEAKRRIHIFWCKRIREGDTTTPWWFPAETKGGSMMEDRLVFPIPPGTHWSDAKPIVLPRHTHAGETRRLEGPGAGRSAARNANSPLTTTVTKRQPLSGGLTFASPAPPAATKTEPPKRQRKEKVRNDPQFVAAARELRDRWLERVNAGGMLIETSGKYDVSKALAAPSGKAVLQLPHAVAA